MVPHYSRHRAGIDSLKKELLLANGSTVSTASSPSLAVNNKTWRGNEFLSADRSLDYGYSNLHSATVGDKIPGFRTSAAFFSSLRTNLHLGTSPPPSPMSTPPSMRASASSIGAPPSPLQQAMDTTSEVPEGLLASIPELSSYVTESPEEKTAALKLVADSVAQMQQTANRILMFHPLNVALFVALLAVVGNHFYRSFSDIGIIFTTSAGLTMAALVTVRWITAPYTSAAEKINVGLLDHADVLVTKFGEEIMGTVILGWVDGETKGKRRKYKAEIRGWAVRIRYRGKGEGLALLAEAVDLAKKKGAESIDFAADHANSTRILWSYYNGTFDKREKMASEKLQALWQSSSKSKKR